MAVSYADIAGASVALGGIALATGVQIVGGGLPSSVAINPGTDLIFPTDLIQANRQYYINIKFQKYVKRSQSSSAVVSSQGGIKLPLPSQLIDNKAVDYSSSELNPFVGAVVDSLADSKNISQLDDGSFWVNQLGKLGSVAGAMIAGKSDTGRGLLGATSVLTGTAFNPFQSVVFRTPIFREHSFSWRFVPKNQNESNIIKTIIQYLQLNMLPDISTGPTSSLFQYPSILNIQLYPSTDYLYKFKPCVLKNVSVNYAPQSTPAFYKGTSAPVAVDVSINLIEIELWTRKDYRGVQ